MRAVRGCEGAARAFAGGGQTCIARTHKVVDLQDAGGFEACSGGVVAALMARVVELEASAAADRDALVAVQRAFDLQSDMLHTATATAEQASAALQNSVSLLCLKDAQIEALQQGVHEVALTSIQLAQQQQLLLGAWQQRCDQLFWWGMEWAVYSNQLLGGGCADGRGLGMGLAAESVAFAAENGGSAGWVAPDREREAETGGAVVEACGEAAGGFGGDGVGMLDCSVEVEEEGSAQVPSTTPSCDNSVFLVPSSPCLLGSLSSSHPGLEFLGFCLLVSVSSLLIGHDAHFRRLPFSGLPMLQPWVLAVALFHVRAVGWVARRNALGLSGLRRGRCMAARTTLTRFVLFAFCS